jgi:hypothetical protein
VKLYGFVVSTHRTLENGYSRTTHSPIMWLDPNVQGILSVRVRPGCAAHGVRLLPILMCVCGLLCGRAMRRRRLSLPVMTR